MIVKTDCETNGSSAAIVKRERFPLYWVLQGHDRWAAQLRSVLAFVFNMSWVGELTICIPASEYLNIFNIWCCLKLQRRRKKCWIIRRVQSSGEGDNFYCLYVSHQQRFCWQNWSTLFMTMFKAMFFKYIICCEIVTMVTHRSNVSMNTIREGTCTFDLIWKLSVEAWRAVLCASE